MNARNNYPPQPDRGFTGNAPEFPPGAPPESIEFLQKMIETFNRSAAGLQEAYQALQVKFDQVNLRLEETNKNLSRSLAEQERLSDYLTSILESLSSGVLVVDAGGVITLFNRGAAEMTGIPVEEAIGKPYREIMGNDIPEELTPLRTIITGKGVSQLEKTIVHRSGEKIAAGYSISPLVNRHGTMMGAVEIFMDLSRIKALEDEISRMDKLAALGQMAATMAHKIRNPLGGIAGFTGLLELEMGESDRGKRLTGKIME
jgi:PAS domain S-box-containing protein